MRLLTIHNLAYLQRLMAELRDAIDAGGCRRPRRPCAPAPRRGSCPRGSRARSGERDQQQRDEHDRDEPRAPDLHGARAARLLAERRAAPGRTGGARR